MMRIVNAIGILSLALGYVSPAHAQTLEWTRQLDSEAGVVENYGVAADGSGNVYISGDIRYDGQTDAYLSKSDANGTLEWTGRYGTYRPDWPPPAQAKDNGSGVSADGLGNVYMSGSTQNGGLYGRWDAFLRKYDTSGVLLWTRDFGASNEERSRAVSADELGNVYMSGYTYSNLEGINAGVADAYVAKFGANGELQWTRQLGTSGFDESWGVSADGLGNVYMSGRTEGSLEGANAGDWDAFIAKYDANGSLQWTRQLGTSSTDRSYAVSADGLGNVYMSGNTSGSLEGANSGSWDAFVSKYDASGALQWTRQFGTANADTSNGVSTDGLGNVYVTGGTDGDLGGANVGGADAYIRKYDASGVIQWTQQLGTTDNETGRGISADRHGHIYISGTTIGNLDGGNPGGHQVAFVAKYTTVVPEPTSLVLVLTAVVGLFVRRSSTGRGTLLGESPPPSAEVELLPIFSLRGARCVTLRPI